MRADDTESQLGRVGLAAARLRTDAAAVEVLTGFIFNGIDAVVLKGPSLVPWLYARGEAHYRDLDLLVRPGQEQEAEGVLASKGFERATEDRSMPDWWREHSTEWQRPSDMVTVDLHRRIVGVNVDPTTAWELLGSAPEMVLVAGTPVPALPPSARLLHVVLHAAQHGIASERSTGRVRLALERLDTALWPQAADLARRLDAVDAFAAGLRLAPDGGHMADRLGLPEVSSVDVALRASTPPPTSLGFEQLASAPGVRARIRIAARKIVPPREFMVRWDPRAAETRTRLALAYLRRPMWILRAAPRGFRVWRRARREVRGQDR